MAAMRIWAEHAPGTTAFLSDYNNNGNQRTRHKDTGSRDLYKHSLDTASTLRALAVQVGTSPQSQVNHSRQRVASPFYKYQVFRSHVHCADDHCPPVHTMLTRWCLHRQQEGKLALLAIVKGTSEVGVLIHSAR